MSNDVTVDLVDVEPDAVRDRADTVTLGCQVFDASGNRYRVRRVQVLKKDRRKIIRDDGISITLNAGDEITYVPRHMVPITRKARELSAGAIVVGPNKRQAIACVRQRMKGDTEIRVRWVDQAYGDWSVFANDQDVTFIPSPARRPIVGQGATEHLHTDKLPYVVVGISDTGHTIELVQLRSVGGDTGHEPHGYHNGFPVWAHTYTDAELISMREGDEHVTLAKRGRDGAFRSGRCLFSFDGAQLFRNYAE